MRRKLLISLLLFPFLLVAGKDDQVEILTDLFQMPTGIIDDCVNVISGNYFVTETDLYVPGPHPIVYQRFYNSSNRAGLGYLHRCWDDNYHIFANYYQAEKKKNAYVVINEQRGSLTYKGKKKKDYTSLGFKKDHLKWGVVNGVQGTDSGRSDVMNRDVRLIMSDKKPFVKMIHENGEIFRFDICFNLFPYTNSHWLMPLTSKWKDNGTYQVNGWSGICSWKKSHFYDKDNQFLGSINLSRQSKQNGLVNIRLELSNGRAANIEAGTCINSVVRANAPQVDYKWCNNYLTKRSLPDKRYKIISYKRLLNDRDRRDGRVSELRAPVGPDASPITTYSFTYHLNDNKRERSKPLGGSCVVRDAYQNKKVYYFNDTQRLTRREDYEDENSIYRKELYYWGNQGELKRKITCSPNRILSKIFHQNFDFNRNLTSQTIGGNLTGHLETLPIAVSTEFSGKNKNCEAHTIKHRYNQRNLLTETNDERKIVKIAYIGTTSQIFSKLISDGKRIRERTFYTYGSSGAVIEEIHDNGSSDDPFDLTGVTERLITRTETTSAIPFGLPKVVEEYYLDIASGEEVLLKRTVNDYSCEGFLLKQQVYDNQEELASTHEWKYNTYGNPIWEIDPLGRVVTRAFDTNGNQIEEITPVQKTLCQYDFSNRLIKKTLSYPETLSETYTYDYKSNLTSSTDIYGNTTDYTYDSFDRLIRKTLPSNQEGRRPVEEYSYDIEDRITVQIDANSCITKKAYTAWDHPYFIEHPDGAVERCYYELDGTLQETVDQNGTRTAYAHDYKGRKVLEETYSHEGELLRCKQWEYDSLHLIKEVDPEGIVTEYTYDGAGRLASKTCGEHETLYGYDSLGRQNQTWEKFSEGQYRVTIQVFDALNQLIEERVEDQEGNLFSKVYFYYDFDGNLVKRSRITDEGCETASKEYNSIGQVTKTVDPAGNKTFYTYTYGKNPTTVEVDALGRQTRSVFDSRENLISQEMMDPLGHLLHSIFFTNDPVGNLLQREDRVFVDRSHERTLITAFEYDQLNRQTAIIEPEGKVTRTDYTPSGKVSCVHKPDGKTITHCYDALDRLEELYSSDGTVHYRYRYDLNDQIIQTVDEINQATLERTFDEYGNVLTECFNGEYEIGYAYDDLGRLQELMLPDHSTIDYSYDAAHLTSVERNGYRHQYVYDLSGRVKETLSSSIGETHYRYDPRGAPLSLVSENLSQESVYDSVGNLTSLKHLDPLGEVNASYTYDHLNQLASESGFVDHVYLTDSISNRRLKDDSSYQVNDLNQLVNLDGRHFSYDQNGNLEDFEAPLHCVYDALDRLTEVHTQDRVYRYAYDPFHRRLSRMVDDQNDLIHEQHYLYSGECEIGYIEQGEIRQLRVLGNSNTDIGSAVFIEIDDSTYVPQHDLRGNVSLLIDSSGNTEVYRYSAFGEELFASATSPWRFSSKRVDEETGWVYFGRRYFAPDWGRWTTADPAWFADGPNLYAYVHNNPLRYMDPDGLSAVENKERTLGTFFGSFAWGAFNDTSYGLADKAFGSYECDNWQSKLGYGLGTATSLGVGLFYGSTEFKIAGKALGYTGKGIGRLGRMCNFTAKEVNAASKFEGTAAKISREITPKFEKPLNEVISNGQKLNNLPSHGRINPFKDKTFEEIDSFLKQKGFTTKGPDPMNGKGSYFHPLTNRKYYLDHAGKTYRNGVRELPHVDVHYKQPVRDLEKKRFPLGEKLYE